MVWTQFTNSGAQAGDRPARRCQLRPHGFPVAAHSDPQLKRECFVYKWQAFLGGIASAAIIMGGAAAPAMAQTAAGSPLTNLAAGLTGSQVTASACNLGGVPMAGQVNSAVAGATGQSCSTPSSSATSASPAQAGSTSTPMTSALPGLSTVTGAIPGLSSMSSNLPVLQTAPSQSTANSTAPSNVPADAGAPNSTANAPSLGSASVPGLSSSSSSSSSSDPSMANQSVIPGSLTGVTGALPVGSLTGGLPGLGSLSGVTGSQG
jgi:hypothetical protein